MNIKRFLCIALAVLMTAALVPMAALAEGLTDNEAKALSKLDAVWAELEAVEAEAVASGAGMSSVTMAVYQAALQLDLVDANSFNSLTAKSFFFTVDGMACCYDFTARNYQEAENRISEDKLVETVPGRNCSSNTNILLIGPYYGHDSSFTDQYRNEAQSLANVTGGSYILLQSTGATGPAIANACPNAGVVIFDSHGTHSGNSSYLCLTTNSGITQQDYQNGWAVNAGSAAYIDGRYILNHAPSTLPNNFFWMAICEGMMRQGQGTTGYALLQAGAAAVYGYSQSVTFAGDYVYEATFWNMMKDGADTAEALEEMKEVHGIPDPYGDAYPILMSPVDPFPANPDGPQEVYCDWTLLPDDPVELESYSLSADAIEVYETFTETVVFERVPDNANQYELEWFSENSNVAAVAGNNRKVKITGVSMGQTRIGCTVKVNGDPIGTAYCNVNVLHLPNLNEAANIAGGNLNFTNPSGSYGWTTGIVEGTPVAKSGNVGVDNSNSSMQVVVEMQAGETFSFRWKVSSEQGYDFLKFFVNNTQYGQSLSGETDWANVTYTAANSGTYTFKWTFSKDQYVGDGDDCGYVDDVCWSGANTFIPGDVDGNDIVDASDALVVLRYSMSLGQLTQEQLVYADFNQDGVVDTVDALLILRRAMNII